MNGGGLVDEIANGQKMLGTEDDRIEEVLHERSVTGQRVRDGRD